MQPWQIHCLVSSNQHWLREPYELFHCHSPCKWVPSAPTSNCTLQQQHSIPITVVLHAYRNTIQAFSKLYDIYTNRQYFPHLKTRSGYLAGYLLPLQQQCNCQVPLIRWQKNTQLRWYYGTVQRRVIGWGPRGRRFKSCIPDLFYSSEVTF